MKIHPLLQLGTIVQESVGLAVAENVLDIKEFRPQASWDRIGRYAKVSREHRPGLWLGIRFDLWKTYGGTPLWMVFRNTEFGRAQEVRHLIEPWAAQEGVNAATVNEEVVVALDIPIAEEKLEVIRSLVDRIREIGG